MNTKTRLVLFLAITALNNNNLCMETETDNDLQQLLIIKTDKDYKKLKNVLKKKVVDTNYNSIHPAQQYEMLKTCIDKNNMVSLKICLTYKFSPNRYRKGVSLLHYAIERNNSEALWLLASANPDLVPLKSSIPLNHSEETPLNYAIILNYPECIYAMSHIIRIKYNDIIRYKKHCGLIKHLIKPERPCLECIHELSWELQWHGIYYRHYSVTSDNYSTATDADSHTSVDTSSDNCYNCCTCCTTT